MKAVVAGLALAAACSLSAPTMVVANGAEGAGASRSDRGAGRPPAGQSAEKQHGTRVSPATTATPANGSTEPAPSPFTATPSTYAPRYTSPSRDRSRLFVGFSPFFLGYVVPPSSGSYGASLSARETPDSMTGQQGMSGSLYLDVEPRTAQVYVDGSYIGTVDDFTRTSATLSSGPHRIELRSAGYEALTIEVNIVAGHPTRYRGNLPAARRPTVDVIPPHVPETIYMIPGCYAGNRAPSEAALPRGCDIARMRTFKD